MATSADLMYWFAFGSKWPVRLRPLRSSRPPTVATRKPGIWIGKVTVAHRPSPRL